MVEGGGKRSQRREEGSRRGGGACLIKDSRESVTYVCMYVSERAAHPT